jgi:N-acetyl-anhydromuramyl-L-alanine amidase AmpD
MTWDATYHHGRPRVADHGPQTPRRIVLHSTESDGDGAAYGDAICGFWARQNRGYGAHFVIARDGAVSECLARTRVAWHVANRNTGSVGIEQAGFAKFTALVWGSRERELDATARVIARVAEKYGIPLEHSTDAGVCTHADCSRDFGGDHHDPGNGYPFAHVLGMARSYLHAGGWSVPWNAAGK